MDTGLSVEDLIAFETRIAARFNNGEIRAPVHLSTNNEQHLIDIFKGVEPEDWICGSWRSHYHCLLKGVPADELEEAILAGRSISLTFPRQRVICSGIVGGTLPIALGLAWEIKRQGGKEVVWAFCGDMASMSGQFHEVVRYSDLHELPMKFVIEDNGKSVCTETKDAWGESAQDFFEKYGYPNVYYYAYDLTYPHAGAGKRVMF